MEENSCCCGQRGEKEFICPTTVNLRQSTRDDADEKEIKGTDEEGTEAVGKPKNRVIAILVASIASISTLCTFLILEDAVDEEEHGWKRGHTYYE